VCQAACPQCARETDPHFDRRSRHHLRIEHIQREFADDVIRGLDKMFMCGNYGDPAAGYYTLDIYRWFRKLNPNIVMGMNSNGAVQSTFWWHELANILNQPRDYVVFSIDGLEDTNGIYRVNVNWQRLMANATAFIAAGGSAHWDMLVYQHNQHQVEACEQLARDMGFRWFRAKVSRRPMTRGLALPTTLAAPASCGSDIVCQALQDQSIYMDAQGRVSPCCWLGSRQRDFITDFDAVQASWNTAAPNTTCLNTCGTNNDATPFQQQWRREVALC
jgi:sulfatase maturation enzyme AslB (radical SAM superfamily)